MFVAIGYLCRRHLLNLVHQFEDLVLFESVHELASCSRRFVHTRKRPINVNLPDQHTRRTGRDWQYSGIPLEYRTDISAISDAVPPSRALQHSRKVVDPTLWTARTSPCRTENNWSA